MANISLILELNARYEVAWGEYHKLEDESGRLVRLNAPAHAKRLHIDEASRENQREIDALRLAILYQVPSTYQEALVLACHVHTAFAITDAFDSDQSNPERQAFETGLDTLLDFLFGEIDHEEIAGGQMKHLAQIVYCKRRLRNGLIEAR